ncbi:c-di-GMP phosphodiesterase [Anaerobacillus alkalidiazotrophicus]|uniref:C-di-GMP phosphodiesterase n=1 Tax=Anaerobacillus alkalidiazotrophicus TaxID=472963 RepID=A0A1S2MCP0_9BACI|nr:HD domain-containing phosphohydrolase [Anaerobacillus alkalidiazotrophicus]OIJ21435.1 c-di-GMP phosphodiesterase [Anaerobacillus alkalidiazotrophicus]
MRMINIQEYDKKTMLLAEPIYDYRKRILLASGSTIHPKYMEKLKEIGIRSLIIEDAISVGITLDEMIDMPTWIDAITMVEQVYQQAKNGQKLSITELQNTVKKLINEVSQRRAIILIPTSTIDEALALYAHVVNVTLISLQIAKKLNLNQLQLSTLGLGTLLHDIGKMVTTEALEHPEKGFQLLKSNPEVSLLAAHVAYQHHETYEGSGFPRGIKIKQIIDLAQVCMVANDYENMISKEGYQPHEAIEKIMSLVEKKYSYHIVLSFTNGIISYPPGTHIRLNNGLCGIVIRIDSHLHRPIIKVEGISEEIDLSEQSTLFIEKVYNDLSEN